ncbi:hypothetical protein EBS02_09835 [bacterium]|nr:hypothetical protein [bacterium]
MRRAVEAQELTKVTQQVNDAIQVAILRLMNELPVRSRNATYKPTYFYKIHESYRIKQNLLALVYFLVYMNIIQKIPMIKDLPLDELNKQDNSSESF